MRIPSTPRTHPGRCGNSWNGDHYEQSHKTIEEGMSSDRSQVRKAGWAESRKPFIESEELDSVFKVRFYWVSELLGVLFEGDSSSQESDSVNLDRMPRIWFFVSTSDNTYVGYQLHPEKHPRGDK